MLIYCAALGFVLAARSTSEASIQAFEVLVDVGVVGDVFAEVTGQPTDGLTRARGYLNPFSISSFETDDGDIAPAIYNGVVNMGNFTSQDTSFTHRLDWLVPPALGSYLNATLYIAAVGYEDPSEVIIDGFSLGSLDGIISTYAGIDVTLLGDDLLNVVIDKGTYNFRGTHPNNLLAIVGSKLVVEYEAANPAVVPEAGSFFVWSIIAGMGLVVAKRRICM
jgi:hypothetical protein